MDLRRRAGGGDKVSNAIFMVIVVAAVVLMVHDSAGPNEPEHDRVPTLSAGISHQGNKPGLALGRRPSCGPRSAGGCSIAPRSCFRSVCLPLET